MYHAVGEWLTHRSVYVTLTGHSEYSSPIRGTMLFRSAKRSALAVGFAAVFALVAPLSASAADDPLNQPNVGAYPTVLSVINISRANNVVNYGNRIIYCGVGTTGTSCTISNTYSASRTIATSLGITRSAVAGSLSISDSYSQSVGVTCSSPPMSVGQKFAAYPYGTRLYYQVKKATYGYPDQYSGNLTAFSPNGSIYCRVE